MKYKFILKKIQYASIENECTENDTVNDVIEKVEHLSDEELKFGNPEYHLEAISKEEGKISKIVWRSISSLFSILFLTLA